MPLSAGRNLSADDLFGLTQSSQPSPQNKTVTADDLSGIVSGQPQPTPLSWGGALVQGATNVPTSAYNFGEGIYQSVRHPLDTIKNVLDIGAGALRNIEPKQLSDWLDSIDWNPQKSKENSTMADQVGYYLKNRYGSTDGVKNAIATDPVGVLSDISSVFTGGETVAGKLSKLGTTAQKIENLAGTVAKYTNPIELTSQAVQKIVPNALGLSTGVGAENVVNAFKAGQEGDQSFLQGMRNQMPWDQPLQDARYNLNVMKQNRSNAYRSGMVDISNDKSVLNFDNIDSSLKDAKDSVTFGGKTISDNAVNALDNVKSVIDDWKNGDPNVFHTPEGMDALKQKVGDILMGIPYEDKNTNRVVGQVYNAIKSTISDQAPIYSNVMKDYSDASEQISEIEKALKLGGKASADTAMRALQSITRNNVNTNYGGRLSLAQQLEQEGGRPFINALSGQAMSSPTARGLANTVSNATLWTSLLTGHPLYALSALGQSPRVVGEAMYKAGQAYAPISNILDVTGMNAQRGNFLADIIKNQSQAQQGK